MADVWCIGRATLRLYRAFAAEEFKSRRSSLVESGLSSQEFLEHLRVCRFHDNRQKFTEQPELGLLHGLIDLPVELRHMIIEHAWSSFLSPVVVLCESRLLVENARRLSALPSEFIELSACKDVFFGLINVDNNCSAHICAANLIRTNIVLSVRHLEYTKSGWS